MKDSLKDIFEVRHLLEPHIAALAAERATPKDIRLMGEAIEDQEKQIALGETGVEGDTAFHFAMAQSVKNWALLIVISNIEDVLRESRDLSLQSPGRPQRSLDPQADPGADYPERRGGRPGCYGVPHLPGGAGPVHQGRQARGGPPCSGGAFDLGSRDPHHDHESA